MRLRTTCLRLWFVFSVLGLAGAEETKIEVAENTLPKVDIVLSHDPADPAFSLGDGVVYSLGASGPGVTNTMEISPNEKDDETGISIRDHKIYFIKEGEIQIPAHNIVDATGKVIAATNPLGLNIESVTVAENEKPHGLYGPIAFSFPREWIFIGIGAFLVLLALAVYQLLKWSQKRKMLKSVMPNIPKPLFRECVLKMEAIRLDVDWRERRYKRVAYQFSEILKEYLSLTFKIPAEESTSVEVYRLLEGAARIDTAKDLERLFIVLDLIKFTDFESTSEEMEKIFIDARDFILRWKDETIYASR